MKDNTQPSLADDLRNDFIQVRLGSMLDLLSLAYKMAYDIQKTNNPNAKEYLNQLSGWSHKS